MQVKFLSVLLNSAIIFLRSSFLSLICNFPAMKEVVMNVQVDTEKSKQKVMKAIHGFRLEGVQSINMDMKNQKLTMIGDFDPTPAVTALSKLCAAKIVYIGPAKEYEREEPKIASAVERQEVNGCVIF